MLFINRIFPHAKVKEHGLFAIIRNSLLNVDERAEDLMMQFETALDKQRHGAVIALTVSQDMPDALVDFLTKKLDIVKAFSPLDSSKSSDSDRFGKNGNGRFRLTSFGNREDTLEAVSRLDAIF